MALKKSELYSSLWQSCDELRGGMDALQGDKEIGDKINKIISRLAEAAREDLNQQVASKYGKLTEAELKTLAVEDKWLERLQTDVKSELDRVSQALTSRVRELAQRYATPLPQLVNEVEKLSAKVDDHLKKMGFVP